MREPEEVEGLRFDPSLAASVLARKAPELDQPRLLGVQLQPELAQPLGDRALTALGVVPVLEPSNPIAGMPHRDHITPGLSAPPLLNRLSRGRRERVLAVR
jgi:hypothetical protein